MKKYILFIASIAFLFNNTTACSWYSEDASYYNLFNQNLISDKTLTPFFLTYDESFYGDAGFDGETNETELNEDIDYNILEWKKFFDNQVSVKDLNYLVYQSKPEELRNILSKKSLQGASLTLSKSIYLTEKGMEALRYLIFAKECEPFAVASEESSDDSWYYGSIRKKMTKPEFMSTAKDGNILYANTKNADIKLRIAYQLVRLSHYGGFNDDAIRYFKTYVEPLKLKNLIYYYALEQKAGALFNQKKYAEAGANYASVFHHTPDRKLQCYASFRISNQMDFDKSIALCKTSDEKAALYVLRGFNKFSNGLSEMKNIYAIAPNSAYLELMACRTLLQMEHNSFEIPSTYNDNTTFPLMDAKGKLFLQKVILFTENLVKSNKVKRIDFWQAYLAHLYLLNGQYIKSKNIADKINSNETQIMTQAQRTSFCAYIGSLKTIDKTAEENIFKHYTKNIDENEQNFVYDILAHNYILQKDYAQAFLCHNDFSGLYSSLNINIINSLIDFFKKETKSAFEQQLIKKHITSKQPLQELYDLKGTYYFKKDDLVSALVWYKKVDSKLSFLKIHEYNYDDNGQESIIEKDGTFNGYSNISAGIFSCSIQTYFDQNLQQAFTDKTYKNFSFIKETMNKQELVEALIELKKLANGTGDNAAKANFVLGNFYYNTSNWGYYRNFFYYEPGNYYLSYLYTYSKSPVVLKPTYNYNGGTGTINNNKIKQPYDYFLLAENKANDMELKAKAVFQASKCELDLYFDKCENSNYANCWSYDNYKPLYSSSNRPLFKKLKDRYSKTAYYNEIKSNCNYFKYYLKFKL
ncbi:MAG: hypothetical protein KDD21_11455 [Bacteroidetes bacterium]|nr:hypothetical protein [Bacteroidota bacterium]